MNLYFTILWIITFINQTLACPKNCSCTSSNAKCEVIPYQQINFNKNYNYDTIVMRYNKYYLPELTAMYDLKGIKLRELQVIECHKNIKTDALRITSKLKKLKIANCPNINEISSDIIENTNLITHLYFINLPSLRKFSIYSCHMLKVLKLHQTGLKKFEKSPFYDCPHLTSLTVTKSNLETLNSDLFKGLMNLVKLNLNDNSIAFVRKYSFHYLRKLQILILSNNKIRVLNSMIFSKVQHLKFLNINHNPLIDFQFVQNLGNIRKLYINTSYNGRLKRQFDLNLLTYSFKLKEIKLSDQICVKNIKILQFLPLPIISYISKIVKCDGVIYRYPICSRNCICKSNKMKCDITINSYLSCVTDLKIFSIELVAYRYRSHEFKALLLCNLKETTELKIRGFHNITKVSEHPFSKLPNLLKLQIIGVNDQLIPDKFIYASRQLNELHLIDLNVRRLTFPIFMKCRLGVLVIKNCPNLKLVDLHLYICINLEILIITHTNITRITDENLLGLSRLRKLDLSRNRIRTIDQYAFTPLNSIQTLILSHNQIKALPFNLFQLNNKLTVLEMEFNLFDRNLDFFKLLRYSNFVNLNYNQMQYLDLDYLIGKTNLTKIGVNSIYCIKNKHKSLYKLNKELIKKFKKFKTCAEFNNKTVIDNNTYKNKNKKRNNPAIGCDISGENIKNALNFTNYTYLLNIILIGISLIAIESILMILYYRNVKKVTKKLLEKPVDYFKPFEF